MIDPDRARELLQNRRSEIERALAELSRRPGDREDDPFDEADAAPDLFEEELSEGLGERLREELGAIERAEQRLAEGTYGRSVESGEPIPDGRLEAIPWAERTAAEQSRYEGRGR
jgi:DnaK suppressor protein